MQGRRPSILSPVVVTTILLLLTSACAHRQPEPPPPPQDKAQIQKSWQEANLDELREEWRRILEEGLQQQRDGSTGAPGRPMTQEEFQQLTQDLVGTIRGRIQVALRDAVEQEFGPIAGPRAEAIYLEAIDKRGRTVEVPVTIQARPLRSLVDPANSRHMRRFLRREDLAVTLYDDLPAVVAPAESEQFRRVYQEEGAAAIAAEAKLIVTMKGGEWVEPTEDKPVANVVAVRGLDLTRGLIVNSNQRYDDTMYLIVDPPGSTTEVYEYRMTTESSSDEKGTGRLKSMQVTYIRGLHRKKDPAYRLKGNAAEGTRSGLEGTYDIVGANIHSAYSRRPIDSETPLKANVSLGCQVVAASKSDFEKLMVSLLDKKGVRQFPYTIVDGAELALFNQMLLEHQRHSVLVYRVPRPEAIRISRTGGR